ncbi:MAG: hypothetical protein H6654_15170 [Ardenticatenaceae bacterium]|nr:hypothetical protein [Anaerolineales bacterium]MCB8939677.1 hypothetical protein [Ardenticatenaceae bacterium]MCB8974898.1 hypothetical protein [Ardenticatenaceae bacterium]
MSYNRLGTLAAGILGLGWLVAVGVNLGVWYPQMQTLPPGFWDDGDLFLAFVRDNALSWQVFHIGTTVGLCAAVFLVGLLAEFGAGDNRARAFTTLGTVGAVFGVIASLLDQLGTPVVARFALGNPLFVAQIWEYMEPFRDAGLKTISFAFMGLWLIWLAGKLGLESRRLGQFTTASGVALVLLALVEAMVPPPLAYTVGETGFGGFVVLLIPIWSLWLARWFWQRELAGVGN